MTQLLSPFRFLRLYQSLLYSKLSLRLLSLGLMTGSLVCMFGPSGVSAQMNADVTATEVEAAKTGDSAKKEPFRGVPIPPERVQQMLLDLAELEDRYELTLAAAGVLQPTELSMVDLLERLQSGDDAPTESVSVPARYVGTVRALNQAKQYRQDFQSQIEQEDYLQASRTWLKAKNVLTDHFPTSQSDVSPHVRAIWLDRGTIVEAQSEDGLKRLFDRMKRAGINVVFFETVNAGYPVYPSNVAPQQNPLIQGWDPLEAAIALAHERDMELHAWVWVFSAANERHNEIVGVPENYPGPVLEKHPTWAITDRNGQRPEWVSGKSFMDPANPDVRDYLQRLFDEIVTRYDVDGLQLDYIRYPFQNPLQGNIHGYSFEARRQFQKQYRVDPIQVGPGHYQWRNWLNFKAAQIDSFVQETSERLKATNPDLIISAAVFPMETRVRHQNLQQNWQRWVKAGWVDLLVPMTYASNVNAFQMLTEPLFEEEFQGEALMIPGLRLLNMPSYKTLEQVHFVQRSPTSGYALFAAAHFRSSLASTLNRPDLKTKPVLPHREPLHSAAIAYSALQREWQYWLERHVSQEVDFTNDLEAWASQVDQVSAEFDMLLDASDRPQLEKTTAALTELRSSDALLSLSPSFAEQLNRWDSRLQTIQMLLNYGKKTIDAVDTAEQATSLSQVGE